MDGVKVTVETDMEVIVIVAAVGQVPMAEVVFRAGRREDAWCEPRVVLDADSVVMFASCLQISGDQA